MVFPLFLSGITSNSANYQLGALDGWRYTVWYATHKYISLYFLKGNKMTKKNIFRPVFLLFFRWNLFGSSQIPIRSSRWMNTCCLICDMTIFHWIFENTKMSPKITFWRRKITFPAVFPLYLVAITSNSANYQLAALDGRRHAVWYATWLYFFDF